MVFMRTVSVKKGAFDSFYGHIVKGFEVYYYNKGGYESVFRFVSIRF